MLLSNLKPGHLKNSSCLHELGVGQDVTTDTLAGYICILPCFTMYPIVSFPVDDSSHSCHSFTSLWPLNLVQTRNNLEPCGATAW